MKYVVAILLVLMTMVEPAGCDFEQMFNENFGAMEAPNAENRFEADYDIAMDEGENGGIVNGGNISYDETDKEVEQPEVALAVLDKIDYKKPIVGYTDMGNGPVVDKENAGAYGNHVIRVPYIAGIETEEITNLNGKIYNEAEKYYNILLNGQEGMNTYNIDYYFAQNEKAISIILEINIGEQMVGGTTFYKGYYYDCENHVEITFDDYILKMGYTKESFNSMLLALKSKYFTLTEKEVKNVVEVAISEDKIYLVIKNPDAVDAEPYVGLWTFDK